MKTLRARLAFLLLLFVSVVQVPAAETFDLTTEFQRLPLGMDCPIPRFSWKMAVATNSDRLSVRGQAQTAYRILVASTPDKLIEGSADIVDSGRVTSSESVLVNWKLPTLKSKTRYYWTVRIWDQAGKAGNYAPPGLV